MNILKYLFGPKGKTDTAETAIETPVTVADQQTDTAPPMELFIDNEAPQTEQNVEQLQSRVTNFLNRNYHSMGIQDGYEYHTNGTLETAQKKIRSEFQLIIDQTIQEKLAIRLQLKNMVVDVNKISDDAKQKLENTIEELEASLTTLQQQKELSAENEGWVMNAIHSYQQGFIQGVNQWTMTEQLLYSPQIFNSKN